MVIKNVLIKKIKVPFYGSRLWIVVSPSISKSMDVVEDLIDHKINVDDATRRSSSAYTYAYDDGTYHIMVFLRPKNDAGEIAHESLHAVNILHHWHGVRPSYNNDESVAYFLTWLVNKCHACIKEHKKKFIGKL